jgi:FHS family L-fucose permease-like MFS transporter
MWLTTIGSLIYFAISKATGGDILNRIGIRNGISLGLVISCIRYIIILSCSTNSIFPLNDIGIIYCWSCFSLQQTAANPLAIVMGDPKTGQQRLSMAGGINNLGTTIGPLLVSFAIFGTVSANSTGVASIESVKTPYLILGGVFLLAAIVFRFSSVPNKIDLDKVAEEEAENKEKLLHRKSVFNYPQLVLGNGCHFCLCRC